MKARQFLFSALTILALALSCSASEAADRGGRPSYDRLLTAFDANGDGSLTQDEVPIRVWARLSQADADGDGSVTRDEFDSY